MKCLVFGHRPIEMAAQPDQTRCRQANVTALLPGEPVVVCAECLKELYVGPMHVYLDLLDRAEPATFH